jgi:hypothetical protein
MICRRTWEGLAVATEIVTLPGHLRVLFDKVYEGEADTGNGWSVWQRVLQARIQDAPFFKRLSAIQLACRTLRLEVDSLPLGTGSVTPRTKTSWIQAIDQLTSLTVPSDFHLAIPQWRQKARQSDITLLDTIHVYYNLLSMFVEYDPDAGKSLAAELAAFNEEVKKAEFDARAKIFFVRALDAAKFAIDNMMLFGFESAWAEGVNLWGGVLRYRNELAANAALQQKMTQEAWRAMQFFAEMANVKGGEVSIADAAHALLEAAPAA